jgi:ATP-dependent exoDNAse (exonuclease V) beta subunit
MPDTTSHLMNPESIRFINASAGSGKTSRLTEDLVTYLDPSKGYSIKPENVIITTFNISAANEIRERTRRELLKKGFYEQARDLEHALINTVHSVGHKLIRHYAFEGGLPTEQDVITDNDKHYLLSQAIEEVISLEEQHQIEEKAQRLSFEDWRQLIAQIIDKARANNLGPSGIYQCGQYSVQTLDQNLPEATATKNFFQDLASAANECCRQLEQNGDDTNATRGYLSTLISAAQALNTNANCTWRTCLDLEQNNVGQRSAHLVQDVREKARKHLEAREFQEDLKGLTEQLFTTASSVLERYQEQKASNGQIDYIDMEANLLAILQNSEARDSLKHNVDLLMVDEFQDTSPIQLSIFLKLSELADYSEWVGDPKQAIYSFRGTDPTLMQNLMSQIPAEANDSLPNSYRSRESLVQLSNGIFSHAFADGANYGPVELAPQRDDGKMDPAFHWWHIYQETGGNVNKQQQVKAIAYQLYRTLQQPPSIAYDVKKDKNTGEESHKNRPLRAGDVAILCRQRSQCKSITSALNRLGIQAAFQGTGLMDTAEGILFSAALRYLVNPGDTLAATELQLLAQTTPDQGKLIDERLQFLESGQSDSEWGADNPFIQVIKAHQELLQQLPVGKAARKVISLLGLQHYVVHWPNAHQRQANLEQLIYLANQFEVSCRTFNKAATVSGLLIHLNKLNQDEQDFYGSFAGSDAVQVLTYHGAKGLEWPMVILFEVDKELKEEPGKQVFGLKAIINNNELKLDEPLKDQYIRYWPWPYGQKQKLPESLRDTLYTNSELQKGFETEKEEEKRLMYVGMTRARDYLVIPYAGRQLRKLNQLLAFEPEAQLDGADLTDTTLQVNGYRIPARVQQVAVPEELEQDKSVEQSYLTKPSGPTSYAPLYVQPSAAEPLSDEAATINLSASELHPRLRPATQMADEELGDILHGVLATYPENVEDRSDPSERVRQVLINHNRQGSIDSDQLLTNIRAFFQHLEGQHQIKEHFKEWPLAMMEQGQVYSGFADLVLQTSEGYVLVDYKSYQGGSSEVLEKSKEFTGQLKRYKDMLEKATNERVIATYLYYMVSGQLVRVDFSR